MRTKIQYKEFEPGEFTGEKDRTAEETIELITSFPWHDQRDHLVVSLTNPGITIQGSNNDFLKLTPYYNGKYVLRYLDPQHHLYTRSLDRPEDSIPNIRSFFENQPFDPACFRQEATLLQNNAVHFVTRDFRCTAVDRAQIGNLVFAALYLVAIPGILAVVATKQPVGWLFTSPFFVILPFVVALFVNHWKAARGKVLIVSRGLDAFSFGPADNPKTFYKHEIAKSDESQWFPFINRDASALFE